MKKLLFAAIAVFCLLYSSCPNPVLAPPKVPQKGGPDNTGNPPANISASCGGKGVITLTWDAAPNAVKYVIYKTDSLLQEFVKSAETENTQYPFPTAPGSTVYYKVSSAYQDGSESPLSGWVMGSSLAKPLITGITDVTESSATVTWYMENDDTYKNQLLYTVYCFEDDAGEIEFNRITDLRAANITETKAEFSGLSASKRYFFQVEAYLNSDPDRLNSEKSDIMDADTARLFIPDAPLELSGSRGISTNSITVSFKLPDMVDIPMGGNLYEPHPLYFVISRRLYSETVSNTYAKICLYFGTNSARATERGGETFSTDYEPGATVSWADTSVSRGVKYEYQVQSYVDTSDTRTSNESISSTTGWALGEGSLSLGTPVYTRNEAGTVNISAELPLHFTFDPKDEEYRYTVLEKIKPIGDDDPHDPAAVIDRTIGPLDLNEAQHYVAAMDLTQESTRESPGRGIYSYKITISLPDDTLLDTISAIGERQISENTTPIEMAIPLVQDGYADKFVISFENYPNRKYILFESDDGDNWEEIQRFNDPPLETEEGVTAVTETWEFIDQEPGITKYFAMQPIMVVTVGSVATDKKGQWAYAEGAFQTMGVPSLSPVTGHSYSTVTVSWTEAQKADSYRIKYAYTGENGDENVDEDSFITTETLNKNQITHDGAGKFTYSFQPEGYNEIATAGKEIQIKVDALNEGLREALNSNEEIVLSSAEDVRTRLVGPAELAPLASQAASAAYIDVSWNKIPGANGYYVYRRQFNMDNSAEEGAETVIYYIDSTEHITGRKLKLESGQKVDTQEVKATVSLAASRYTLRDSYMTDNEYNGAYSGHTEAYKNQQNDMVQGNPYRYFIVPVIDQYSASIGFDYETDTYTLGAITYSNASKIEKTGFTFGFGQNVTATKGTYASNPNADFITNSGIRITWEAPPLLAGAGVTPQYTLYRRTINGGSWSTVGNNITETQYVSTAEAEGIVYEYAVGINGNGTLLQNSSRFIAQSRAQLDDVRGIPNSHGYIQKKIRMESVSRNARPDLSEEVKWFSAGIENANSDNNWGIDGYTVFVMNRNIDANWHEIAELSSNIPNQDNHSIAVTNASGLLKVLRDYKHYFKVRSYALNDLNEKVYSPDPDWNYEALFTANRTNQDNTNFLQTDYVKWGARQITATEFTKIATLAIAWGTHVLAGNNSLAWRDKLYSAVGNNANWTSTSNNGSSGRVGGNHNGSNRWWFYYDNYKPDFDTNANRNNWTYSTTIVSVNTSTSVSDARVVEGRPSVSGQYPNTYVNYNGGFVNITGPSCVSPLYTGEIKFNSLTWTGGNVGVKYPSGTTEQQITGAQTNTPLPFGDQPNGRSSGTESRRFTNDEWY